MPSFGLGSLFADFGFFSVVITGMMSGFLKNFFYRIFLKSKNNISFFLFVLPFGMITSFFLLIYLGIDYFLRLSGKRAEDTNQLLPDN